jgi:hypothetical protein
MDREVELRKFISARGAAAVPEPGDSATIHSECAAAGHEAHTDRSRLPSTTPPLDVGP